MRERRHALNCTILKTNYFRLTALEDNATFTITKGANINATNWSYVEYSTNEGKSWTKFTITSGSLTLTISGIILGNSVLFRGSGIRTAYLNYANYAGYRTIFSCNKKFSASGVIMTLLKGKWADENTSIGTGTYAFAMMFLGRSTLIDAGDLILPPDVTTGCYKLMFENCTNLTRAPELRATTLVSECYNSMFKGCSKLAYLKMLATNISASNCMYLWVPTTVTGLEFHRNPLATWWVAGNSGIPQQSILFDDTEETAEDYTFTDNEIHRIILQYWGNRKGGSSAYDLWKNSIKIGGVNGKILEKLLANVEVINNQFKGNTTIIDFSDFNKFTGLLYIGQRGTAKYYSTDASKSGFIGCTSLKYITLPNTLISICGGYTYGLGCFKDTAIEEIYLPDSVIAACDNLFLNCTKLKTVRWSSNLPVRVNTNDYYAQIFKNCANLETITNYPTTANVIPVECYYNCSKLDFSVITPLFKTITTLGANAFQGCENSNLPNELVFPKVTSNATGLTRGFARRKLYFPSKTTMTQYTFSYNKAELIDIGNVTGSYFAPGDGNNSSEKVTVVLRSTAVPTFSTFNINYVRRIYVSQDILDSFKNTYSTGASITFPIGGTEWITDFGSAYEYADYPQANSYTISDANDYSHDYTDYNSSLTMTVHFSGTNWRTIIFPTDRISGTNIEIAEITGVTATVVDSTLDSFTLTTSTITGDSITPGKPYLIRATDGESTKTLTANPAPVFEDKALPSITLSDNGYQFVIKGSYISRDDLVDSYVWDGLDWTLNTDVDAMKAYMTITEITE